MALRLYGETEDFSGSGSHTGLASVRALGCLFMVALLGRALMDYGMGAEAFLVACWGC